MDVESTEYSIRAIRSTLLSVGNNLDFIKGCADVAVSNLAIVEKDAELELRDLAFECCGLVYLVIHACKDHLGQRTVIDRDMRSDVGELETELNNIRVLLLKKKSGSAFRRANPRKRREDAHKIAVFRSKLPNWLLKFGGTSQESIRYSVRKLVAEHEERARETNETLATSLEGLHMSNSANEPPLHTHSPVTLSMPQPMNIPNHQSVIIAAEMPTPNTSDAGIRSTQLEKIKLRYEEERPQERQRLIQSQQEYYNLPFPKPYSNPEADEYTPSGATYSTEEDSISAARALHEQIQKEFEAEDRRQALLEAGRIQRIMDDAEADAYDHTERGPTTLQIRPPPDPRPIGNGMSLINAPSENYSPVSFDNLHGSGVSIGGGPVNVYNGGGNVTNISFIGMNNNHSINYYRK